MTYRITIASSKGGSGKTTTAINLSVALAERGRSVLIVDLDPQGCLAFALARSDTEWDGLAETLVGKKVVQDVLIATKVKGLSLLARGRLDPNDTAEYEQVLGTQGVLDGILAPVEIAFDYVILDSPSGLGRVTQGALNITDFVVLPLMAEPMAHRGAIQILTVLDRIKGTSNQKLKLLGLLPTFVKLDNSVSLKVLTDLWSQYGAVLETHIPRSDVFLRASELGLPLSFLGGQLAPEARRFESLAAEVDEMIGEMTGGADNEHERPQRAFL